MIEIDDKGEIIGANVENKRRSAIQGSISEISPSLHCDMYSLNIKNKEIWIIEVPIGNDKPYVFSGSIFLRKGANSQKLRSVEEIRNFFQECNRIFFDNISCAQFNIAEEADKQNIEDFRRESNLSSLISNKQIFENLMLFNDEGVIKNGGVMFFGKYPENLFPQVRTSHV